MDITTDELKNRALKNLQVGWGNPIFAFFIIGLISQGIGLIPAVGSLVSLVIGGPLALGAAIFSLKLSKDENPSTSTVFDGFQNFSNAISTYLLMIFIIIGYTLLLIIPGIIRGIAYSQVMFILAKNPGIPSIDALKQSREMMEGHKMDYFILNLSFIGWSLLCILTFGIGFLWLVPYVKVSLAHFHNELAGDEDINAHLSNKTDLLDA
jgi:uncharacterized membrane protein